MTRNLLYTNKNPCALGCGRSVSAEGKTCQFCKGKRPPPMPEPRLLPEDYLMRCAEELAKRHEAREAALVKLGLRREAA